MSSMVRLTQGITAQIVKALLAKKYVQEDLKLEELNQATLAAEAAAEKLAYEAAFTKDQRKMLESAAAGMFPVANRVNMRIEHSPGNYYDCTYSIGEEKPVPFRNSHFGGWQFAAVVDGTHPFARAVEAAKAARKEHDLFFGELRDKKRADERRIGTIINSVTTVKRLMEIWPEVKDYLPESVSGEGGGVPAHLISDINKEFGL